MTTPFHIQQLAKELRPFVNSYTTKDILLALETLADEKVRAVVTKGWPGEKEETEFHERIAVILGVAARDCES
jgi:hypothetical protein